MAEFRQGLRNRRITNNRCQGALGLDVGVYAARLRNARAATADSKAMLAHVERAADELGSARVDVLAFACTASSFIEGDQGEAALRRRMEAASGVPAALGSETAKTRI